MFDAEAPAMEKRGKGKGDHLVATICHPNAQDSTWTKCPVEPRNSVSSPSKMDQTPSLPGRLVPMWPTPQLAVGGGGGTGFNEPCITALQ